MILASLFIGPGDIGMWGLPIAFLLGAVGRRIAGGWVQDLTGINTGDVPVRAAYGLLMGIVAYLAGFWLFSVPFAVAVFGGACMGSPEIGSLSTSIFKAACNWVLPAGVLLLLRYSIGAMILMVVGMAGAVLLLALLANKAWPWGPVGLKGGTQLWEAAWGGLMGVTVFFSVLVGPTL